MLHDAQRIIAQSKDIGRGGAILRVEAAAYRAKSRSQIHSMLKIIRVIQCRLQLEAGIAVSEVQAVEIEGGGLGKPIGDDS